jgi:hypothetical protein
MKNLMRVAYATLIIVLTLATPGAPADPVTDPPVTRVSYWSTRPGKTEAAHAFWKRFTPIFEEMKTQGLLDEWLFVTPELHEGEDWDLAYIWRCHDWTAYGKADQYFSEAVAKMDGSKIEIDFNAAFDGTKHRDELWESTESRSPRAPDAPKPGIFFVASYLTLPGQQESMDAFVRADKAFEREVQRSGLILEFEFVIVGLHTGQQWDTALVLGVKDMAAMGATQQAFERAVAAVDPKLLTSQPQMFDLSKHRDAIWKRVEIK